MLNSCYGVFDNRSANLLSRSSSRRRRRRFLFTKSGWGRTMAPALVRVGLIAQRASRAQWIKRMNAPLYVLR